MQNATRPRLSWERPLSAPSTTTPTVFVARRFARPDSAPSDAPNLNVRGAQYVGRMVTVEEPIRGGRGKVRVGDTVWQAEGADAPAGTRVKVTGVRNTVLVVSPS